MDARGKCQHCDTPIVFPSELAGTDAECPSCGGLTRLFIPVAPAQKTVPRPVPTVPRASTRKKTPVEDTLDSIGAVYLVGGFILATLCGLDCFMAVSDDQPMRAVRDIGAALGSIGLGYVLQTLFRGFGEIIRQLRRQST